MKGSRARTLSDAFRPWFRRLPAPVRRGIRTGLRRVPAFARLVPAGPESWPPGTVQWGSLRRTVPFSCAWGYDRGTPIDRVYIEAFLQQHAVDIRGACLEVLNADYTNRFGGTRVSRRDVLDIDPSNTLATIVADLGEADSLPAERFDCIIFTQTLHLVPDMRVAMTNVWRSLAPGGVLLLTVPALGRHDTRKGSHHDRWRVTSTGLDWLLSELPGVQATTSTYGNLLTCTAFLYGLAAEELSAGEMQVTDAQFPLIVVTRVQKAPVQ